MKVVLDMVITMDQVILHYMFSNSFNVLCNDMLWLITEYGENVKILSFFLLQRCYGHHLITLPNMVSTSFNHGVI